MERNHILQKARDTIFFSTPLQRLRRAERQHNQEVMRRKLDYFHVPKFLYARFVNSYETKLFWERTGRVEPTPQRLVKIALTDEQRAQLVPERVATEDGHDVFEEMEILGIQDEE